MLDDIRILRKLAGRYAIAANDDRNYQNKILHKAVNDLHMIRPVVLIDELPWNELNTDGELDLHCTDPDVYKRQSPAKPPETEEG